MLTVFADTHLGVVLLVKHYPYRFPLLLFVIAIVAGCIFSPILRGPTDYDDD